MASIIEMDTHSPQSNTASNTEYITFWELYERAAKQKYGEDILVSKSSYYGKKVNEIDFQVSLVAKESEPREATRTIVDINMKEYANHGKEAQDETIVKATKSSSTSKENRYKFSTTNGIDFGFGGNIGAQVMGLSVAGGSIGVNAQYKKNKEETEQTEFSNVKGTTFSYEQEEKITVPPGKYVKAKITTYSMRYEMNYTLKFSIKRDASVPLSYKTRCQQLCCGCNYIKKVLVSDMISTLPNYNGEDKDDTVSFTQTGTLSWVGEGCSVDKIEEFL